MDKVSKINKNQKARDSQQAPQGEGRSFLSDDQIKNTCINGKPGFLIKVRLTSYRSLPLSCIDNIDLRIDGTQIPSEKITFILNGYRHKLSEFAELSRIWWFILDKAELFVEKDTPLSPEDHLVEGTLVTVEPYVTGGRFTFYNQSQKRLSVSVDMKKVL